MEIPYDQRFRKAPDIDHYESLYAPGTRDATVWELQRPLVRSAVAEATAHRPDARLLDFACGTGRILLEVESLVAEADGLDISAEMLERVHPVGAKTRLVVGTLAGDATPPEVLRDYDVITAFRFFLNVDDALRRSVLAECHERLRARGGWLLANIHGNTTSIRTLALMKNRDPATMRNTISDREFRALLADAGFTVERDYGIGLSPNMLYRSRLSEHAARLDRWGASRRWTRHVSIDRMYLARCVG